MPSNANSQLVKDFILSQSLDILNQWLSPATFISEQGQKSWIDMKLSFSQLLPLMILWQVLLDLLGSNHSPISCRFLFKHYNDHRLDWRSVSWNDFHSNLKSALKLLFPSPLHPANLKELQTYYHAFDTALKNTIAICVSLKRTCSASNTWWSSELEILHRAYIQKCSQWLCTCH